MAERVCPNCGAVITGLECEYCGTSFIASIGDIRGPVTICYERDGIKHALSMIIKSIDMHSHNDFLLYADNVPYYSISGPTEITICAILTDDVRNKIGSEMIPNSIF